MQEEIVWLDERLSILHECESHVELVGRSVAYLYSSHAALFSLTQEPSAAVRAVAVAVALFFFFT